MHTRTDGRPMQAAWSSARAGAIRRGWVALVGTLAIAGMLTTNALLTTGGIGRAGASGAGPDPTLLVASIPPPGDSGVGDVVQAFDSATNSQLGSDATVGNMPYVLAVTPNGSTAYVANQASGTVTPINVATMSPETNLCLPVGSCPGDASTQPEAIAIAPNGASAYVANSSANSIAEILINTSNGTSRVANSPITSPSFADPDAVALTPNGQTLWVANYSNGMVVPVNTTSGVVGTPVQVGSDPTGLAITPNGRDLIVADSGSASVSDVNLVADTVNTFKLEPTSTSPVDPQAVAIAPDGLTAYVTDTGGYIVPVTIASDTPGGPVASGGSYPVADAVSPSGQDLYVADEFSGLVAVFSLSGSAPAQSATITTDGSPDALTLTPDQAPVASFSDTPATTGSSTSFDASASSTTPSGGTLTYSWNFGDGATAGPLTTPTTTHVYSNPGVYTVTLTVTDSEGTSTSVVFTGQTVSNNGAPSATTSGTVTIQSPASGNGIEALVADSGGASATPVSLIEGTSPSASPGLGTDVGSTPSALAITPDGTTAWVVDGGSGQITPVVMATGQAESTSQWVSVGNEPEAIAITPDGTNAYVVNAGSTSVSKVVLETHATTSIPFSASGADLDAIAISPNGATAYVLDARNDTITPIALGTSTVGTPVGGTVLVNPDAIAIAPNGETAYVLDGGTPTRAGGVTTVSLTGANPVPVRTTTVDGAGDHPDAIAISPNGSQAYVVDAPTNGDGASLVPLTLSGTTVTVGRAVSVPDATALYGIAVTPDGTAAYATGALSATSSTPNVLVPFAISGSTVRAEGPIGVGSAPRGIAIVPDQAPIAELSVPSPDAAGTQVTFDASASSNPSSPIASYSFNFGDGTSPVVTPNATTTHAYQVAGVYTATVTETDQAGTSTTQVFTGQTALRNGGFGAEASQTLVVDPTVTSISPASGPAGQSVIINGTGFSTTVGDTTVEFGATTSTHVSCSLSTRCTATAPSGTGTVAVTVTVAGETSSAGSSDQFTYSGGGGTTPTVTSIAPTSGPVGQSVTINGTGFSTTAGATTVDFGSTASTSVSCSLSTRCTATAPSGTGTVAVTVTVAGETSTAGSSDQFTYSGSGGTTPTVTSIAPTSGPVGTTVTIVGTGFSTTAGATTVYFGTTAASTVTCSSTTRCIAHAPTGTGSVTVFVSVGGNTSAAGGARDVFTYRSSVLPPSDRGPVNMRKVSAMPLARWTRATLAALGVVLVVGGLAAQPAAAATPAPTISTIVPPVGAAGTAVTITGTNFDTSGGTNDFSFGSVAVPSNEVSCVAVTGGSSGEDACTMAAPPQSSPTGTVDVTVVVDGQSSGVFESATFTYTTASSLNGVEEGYPDQTDDGYIGDLNGSTSCTLGHSSCGIGTRGALCPGQSSIFGSDQCSTLDLPSNMVNSPTARSATPHAGRSRGPRAPSTPPAPRSGPISLWPPRTIRRSSTTPNCDFNNPPSYCASDGLAPGDTVTISAPGGTVFPTVAADFALAPVCNYVFAPGTTPNAWICNSFGSEGAETPSSGGVSTNASGNTVTITLPDGWGVPQGQSFGIFIAAVANPPEGQYSQGSYLLSTSESGGQSSVDDNGSLESCQQSSTELLCFVSGSAYQPFASVSSSPSAPAAVSTDNPNGVAVTATVLDQYGNPVVGDNVFIAPSSGSNASLAPGFTPPSNGTNSGGSITEEFVDTKPEGVIFTAVDGTEGFTIAQPAGVNTISGAGASADFIAGTPSGGSRLSEACAGPITGNLSYPCATTASVPTNGTPVLVTVPLADQFGNPDVTANATCAKRGVDVHLPHR